jgi:hypothetical protein
MDVGSSPGSATLAGALTCVEVDPPSPVRERLTRSEIWGIVHAGLTDCDVFERVLAQSGRFTAALDLAIGDGLAALTVGDRLIQLGFSCLRDYAREVLDVAERTAESMVQLSRGVRSRPLLRDAVRAGVVRPRAALTVLPVAVGEAEAAWVARARAETVRALEQAVRAVRAADEDEEWTQLRVCLSSEERAVIDEALAIAGKLMPGATRPQRLEAMAQEYLGEHPLEAGDDGAGPVGGSFRPDDRDRVERLKAELEVETERWCYLAQVPDVRRPGAGYDFEAMRSAAEIDRALRDLAVRRAGWDEHVGYCAHVVKQSRLWQVAGFASFEHYCSERLGLSARAVEQRAAVERRIWEVQALWDARENGLAYEKLRLLSRLPDSQVGGWVARARELTCVALKAALDDHDEAQMRAARRLRARVPMRVALLLQAAFRAVRATEGCVLCDASCLVRVARHFVETWKAHVKKARTLSQKIRERDLYRCQVPGCSRRAVHAHHVQLRSHRGPDIEENLVALCGCHHHRGIHGGYIRVRGRAPDRLIWEIGGRVWVGGRIPGISLTLARRPDDA